MKATILCPKCDQKVRVPSDRGEIKVKCPKCELKWLWEGGEEEEPSKVRSFFSKVKNSFTGGGADVSFGRIEKIVMETPFVVKLNIKVGELPIKTKGIYLEIKNQEIVNLPWRKVMSQEQINQRSSNVIGAAYMSTKDFTHSETLFHKKWTMASNQTLEAHKEYAFAIQVELKDALPSYKGKTIENNWSINAYIDSKGVSPKTGWYDIEVNAT